MGPVCWRIYCANFEGQDDKRVYFGCGYCSQHLPFTGLLTILTILIIAIFFITSADSATFVLAMYTSGGDLNPKAGLKITWGLIVGAVAIALMVAGGLSTLQTAAIASAFPFMIVMFAMAAALIKALQGEFTQ